MPIPQRKSPSPSPISSPHSKSPVGIPIWEESGEESDVSSASAPLNRLKIPMKQSRSASVPSVENGLPLIPLAKPARKKSESVSDAAGNPFNHQMADTLIKYILASNDVGLKSALRGIVSSDPEILKALKEE